MLAAGYKGGEVAVWDLDRQQVRSRCRGSIYSVVSLAFLKDGQTLATAGHNGVRFHDVMTGRLILRLGGGGGDEGRALAIDSTGTRMLWGMIALGGPHSVALWELTPHRGIKALRGLKQGARKIWFSSDQKLLACLSDDWHLAIWEIESSQLRYVFEVPAGMYADNAGGAFDANSTNFAFSTWHEARLYDLKSGHVLNQWTLKDGLSDQLQFNARGQLFLVRREDSLLQTTRRNWWRLYELELAVPTSVKPLFEQANANFKTTETLFRFGGEHFFVWDTGPKGTRRTIEAYATTNGAKVWDVTTKELNFTQPSVQLDSAGHWLVYRVDNRERFRLLQLPAFVEVSDALEANALISPSGEQVARQSQNGFLIRDRRPGSAGLYLSTDGEPNGSPSFSLDGRLFAWGTTDGTVLVADIDTVRRQLASLGRPAP
jgi:WD40 repeat protein